MVNQKYFWSSKPHVWHISVLMKKRGLVRSTTWQKPILRWLSGFASREVERERQQLGALPCIHQDTGPVATRTWSQQQGVTSGVTGHAVPQSPSWECTQCNYFLISRGRESSGRVHMPRWGPHDFRVHFWQMPSPPLPTWWHLQKRPGRPPLVKGSLGRDLWEALVSLLTLLKFPFREIKVKQLWNFHPRTSEGCKSIHIMLQEAYI